MTTLKNAGAVLAALSLASLLAAGCTGGTEGNAAEDRPPREAPAAPEQAVNAQQALTSISPVIPIYHGAQYRHDLTRRDQVMIRNQFGPEAQVFTLATDDSFPQVYHYYTTYLAQFRGFPAQQTYPNERKDWRTLEVHLNQAMQDPFIPGQTIDPNGRQVTLQIAETEAEPKTVIRYIVTNRAPAPPAPVATASTGGPAAPVSR